MTVGPGPEVKLQAELIVAPREGPRTLKLVQVIRNGEALREFALDGKSQATITLSDVPGQASWYVVRVVASDGDQAYTSPIRVEVRQLLGRGLPLSVGQALGIRSSAASGLVRKAERFHPW